MNVRNRLRHYYINHMDTWGSRKDKDLPTFLVKLGIISRQINEELSINLDKLETEHLHKKWAKQDRELDNEPIRAVDHLKSTKNKGRARKTFF